MRPINVLHLRVEINVGRNSAFRSVKYSTHAWVRFRPLLTYPPRSSVPPALGRQNLQDPRLFPISAVRYQHLRHAVSKDGLDDAYKGASAKPDMKNHSANGADEGSDIGSGAMEEYEGCQARSVDLAAKRQVGSPMYSCHRSLVKRGNSIA